MLALYLSERLFEKKRDKIVTAFLSPFLNGFSESTPAEINFSQPYSPLGQHSIVYLTFERQPCGSSLRAQVCVLLPVKIPAEVY
jgi:hypothetical protein